MKKVWMILVLSFVSGLVYAQVVPSGSTMAMSATSAPSWLIDLVARFPKLSLVIFVVGGLRLTLKPLFAFGHQFFQAWGLVSFDQAETSFEQSKFYKGFYFALDYLGSIKMPVKEAQAPVVAVEEKKS